MTSVEESRLKVWAELGPQTGSPQPRRDLGSRGRHAAEHCREAVIMSAKQTHRAVEQNRKLRNKPILIWSINLPMNKARIYNGEKDSLFNKYCWEN